MSVAEVSADAGLPRMILLMPKKYELQTALPFFDGVGLGAAGQFNQRDPNGYRPWHLSLIRDWDSTLNKTAGALCYLGNHDQPADGYTLGNDAPAIA